MTDQLRLFSTRDRIDDIETAQIAGVVSIGRAAGARWTILGALYAAGEHGLTDDEISDLVPTSSSRRDELIHLGYVCAAFTVDPVTLGRVPIPGRWELTPSGREFVELRT